MSLVVIKYWHVHKTKTRSRLAFCSKYVKPLYLQIYGLQYHNLPYLLWLDYSSNCGVSTYYVKLFHLKKTLKVQYCLYLYYQLWFIQHPQITAKVEVGKPFLYKGMWRQLECKIKQLWADNWWSKWNWRSV